MASSMLTAGPSWVQPGRPNHFALLLRRSTLLRQPPRPRHAAGITTSQLLRIPHYEDRRTLAARSMLRSLAAGRERGQPPRQHLRSVAVGQRCGPGDGVAYEPGGDAWESGAQQAEEQEPGPLAREPVQVAPGP